VPVGDTVRIVLALRAAHLLDLLSHQLLQHAEPDTDAQREQPLLRRADELPQRLLDPGGNGSSTTSELATTIAGDTVCMVVPPVLVAGAGTPTNKLESPYTLPNGADEGGRTATSSFTRVRLVQAADLILRKLDASRDRPPGDEQARVRIFTGA